MDNCVQSLAEDDSTGYVWFSTMAGFSHVFRSSQGWTPSGPPPSLTWESASTGLPDSDSSYQVVALAGANLSGITHAYPVASQGPRSLRKRGRQAA